MIRTVRETLTCTIVVLSLIIIGACDDNASQKSSVDASADTGSDTMNSSSPDTGTNPTGFDTVSIDTSTPDLSDTTASDTTASDTTASDTTAPDTTASDTGDMGDDVDAQDTADDLSDGDVTPMNETICDDGLDDDMDGDIDCVDVDCGLDPACAVSGVEIDDSACSDMLDNDMNGFTDCDDFSCDFNPNVTICGPVSAESSDAACSNGLDEDMNGFTDCDDFWCYRNPTVTVCEEVCDDGADNDGDGFIDCEDFSCAADLLCEATELTCDDDFDNDGDGFIDCLDSDCGTICPSSAAIMTGINTDSGQSQEVIIYSVDHVQDIVVLRNTTSSPVDLSAGDICRPFSYHGFSAHPAANVIPANSDLVIHLTATGTDTATDMYIGSGAFDLNASDEVMIFRVASGHSPSAIEAYLRYGPAAPSGRQSQAVGVGLWTTGESVSLCDGHDALVATGDVTGASGFGSITNLQVCTP